MRFRHKRIDARPPSGRLSFCLTTDLTGNGQPDVIVGGAGRAPTTSFGGRTVHFRGLPGTGELLRRFENNLFWYENPGWRRHKLADTSDLSVGGALGDLTGNGRLDLVTGQNLEFYEVHWFEQPADPRDPWRRSLITEEFEKHHDIVVGDVDNDGESEVVVLSQKGRTVFYYDVPEEPRRSPWPDSCRHVIASDIDVEGACIVDIDGDGDQELIAGPNVFRYSESESAWMRERIVEDWEWTRVAVADVDGDGEPEVVLTEGDRPHYGGQPGRLGWFDPPDWTPHVLRDDLFCPHSLQAADLTGNGRPDIYVGEMGLGEHDDPKQFVFRNEGDGEFEEHLVYSGVPTHEAKVVDLDGNGRLDVVGKSYTPTHHVDVWYNEA